MIPNKNGAPSSHEGTAIHKHNTPSDYSLIRQAEKLIVDMKGQLPADGIEPGVLHQLPGKMCNGSACTFVITFDDHATYGDLSTGVVVTVDSHGRRQTSMIRGGR